MLLTVTSHITLHLTEDRNVEVCVELRRCLEIRFALYTKHKIPSSLNLEVDAFFKKVFKKLLFHTPPPNKSIKAGFAKIIYFVSQNHDRTQSNRVFRQEQQAKKAHTRAQV